MYVNLVGGAYKQILHDINSQRCINWYPKYSIGFESNKQPKVLIPTPGLRSYIDLSGNRIRGMRVFKSILYVVCDDKFYKITSSGIATLIDTLDRVGHYRRVLMEVNANGEILIIDDDIGYVYSTTDNTFTRIVDTDFVGGISLAYTDGYMAVVRKDDFVGLSNINDANSWDALDSFSPTFSADTTKAIVAFQAQFITVGEYTTEVFINDGQTPFSRLLRSSIILGTDAPDSIVRTETGIIMLGRGEFGGNSVVMVSASFQVQVVSPPSITAQINEIEDVKDAYAILRHTKDGQIFYMLTLPSIDRTFVYDLITQEWHERSSLKPFVNSDGTQDQGRYRANCIAYFNGIDLVGDYYSGKIFIEDPKTYKEDGNTITRLRASGIAEKEQEYITVNSIEFDVNSGSGLSTGQGSNPLLMVRLSQDGGQTYGEEEQIELGALGAYKERVRVLLCGTGRNWVIEIKQTDPMPTAIIGAITKGYLEDGVRVNPIEKTPSGDNK